MPLRSTFGRKIILHVSEFEERREPSRRRHEDLNRILFFSFSFLVHQSLTNENRGSDISRDDDGGRRDDSVRLLSLLSQRPKAVKCVSVRVTLSQF